MRLSKSAAPIAFMETAYCWTTVTNTPARNLSRSAALCVIICGTSFCRLTLISTQNLSAAGRRNANAAVKSSSFVLRDRYIVQPVGSRTNETMRRNDSSEKGTSVTLLGAEMPCKIRTFGADFRDGHKSIFDDMICLRNRLCYRGFPLFQKRDIVT